MVGGAPMQLTLVATLMLKQSVVESCSLRLGLGLGLGLLLTLVAVADHVGTTY